MTDTTTFDPVKYLSKVTGSDYLEVKWRLVWLRDRHPDADITTDMVQYDGELGLAIFKAHIAIPGGGSATGYGTETARDFRDFVEKAETKAIGRALAALGFGTQFCSDHDFGASAGRVVDSPVRRSTPVSRGNDAEGTGALPKNTQSQSQIPGLITPPQERLVRALMREKGVTDEAMHATLRVDYDGKDHLEQLTKRDASKYIEQLQAMPAIQEQGVTQEPQKGYEVNQQGYQQVVGVTAAAEPSWLNDGWSN